MPNQTSLPSTPAGAAAPYRRRQFLIAKAFQFRLTGNFALVLLGSVLLSYGVTLGFLKFREWLDPASQNVMYVAASVNDTVAFARLLDLVWRPMLASMFIGLVFVALFGIFYSHRLAGPLFNLKRRLRELESGDLNLSMHIRRTDEFHDVEEAFNHMIAKLRTRVQKLEQDVLRTSPGDAAKIQALFRDLYGKSTEI